MLWFDTDAIRQYLRDDASTRLYMTGFTPADMAARGLTTDKLRELPDLYAESALQSLPPDQEDRLLLAVAKCLAALPAANPHIRDAFGNMRVVVTDNSIEGGMPFTLGRVVFMPLNVATQRNTDATARVLLHESLHILQRESPLQVDGLLARMGYIDVSEAVPLGAARILRIRRNPDTCQCPFWVRPQEGIGTVMDCYRFASDQPSHLSDGTYACIRGDNLQVLPGVSPTSEHPYEMLADAVPLLLLPNVRDEQRPELSVISEWVFD